MEGRQTPPLNKSPARAPNPSSSPPAPALGRAPRCGPTAAYGLLSHPQLLWASASTLLISPHRNTAGRVLPRCLVLRCPAPKGVCGAFGLVLAGLVPLAVGKGEVTLLGAQAAGQGYK